MQCRLAVRSPEAVQVCASVCLLLPQTVVLAVGLRPKMTALVQLDAPTSSRCTVCVLISILTLRWK